MELPTENQEIIKKIKRLKLKVTLASKNYFAGSHKSFFRGSGLEFDNLRKYIVGDDIRSIDWKTTARYNDLFVKIFHEEKELSFYVFFDISSSMQFSLGKISKYDMALEIIMVFIFIILNNNDKLGLLLFSDIIEEYIPAKMGKIHSHKVLSKLFNYQPKNQKTNIEKAIEYFYQRQNKKSFLLFFSDFLFSSEKLLAFKTIHKKHRIMVFHLQDHLEKSLPSLGLVDFQDSETSESSLIDTSSKYFSGHYQKEYQKHLNQINQLFLKLQIKKLTLSTNEDYLKKMYTFLNHYA